MLSPKKVERIVLAINLIVAFCFCIFFLVGCGSAPSEAGGETKTKALFSEWKLDGSEDGLGYYDFYNASFGNQIDLLLRVSYNGFCNCKIVINGQDHEGEFHITQCSYTGPGASSCQGHQRSYRFTNINANLIACDMNSDNLCFSFH